MSLEWWLRVWRCKPSTAWTQATIQGSYGCWMLTQLLMDELHPKWLGVSTVVFEFGIILVLAVGARNYQRYQFLEEVKRKLLHGEEDETSSWDGLKYATGTITGRITITKSRYSP